MFSDTSWVLSWGDYLFDRFTVPKEFRHSRYATWEYDLVQTFRLREFYIFPASWLIIVNFFLPLVAFFFIQAHRNFFIYSLDLAVFLSDYAKKKINYGFNRIRRRPLSSSQPLFNSTAEVNFFLYFWLFFSVNPLRAKHLIVRKARSAAVARGFKIRRPFIARKIQSSSCTMKEFLADFAHCYTAEAVALKLPPDDIFLAMLRYMPLRTVSDVKLCTRGVKLPVKLPVKLSDKFPGWLQERFRRAYPGISVLECDASVELLPGNAFLSYVIKHKRLPNGYVERKVSLPRKPRPDDYLLRRRRE